MNASALWRLELVSFWRGRAPLLLFVVLTVLFLYAMVNGVLWRARWQTSYDDALAATEAHLVDEQAKARDNRKVGFYEPGAPNAIRMDVSVPPSPASVLAIGRSDVMPRSARISMYVLPDNMFQKHELGSARTLALGRLDVAFVLAVLAPLAVIALCFNLFAADRELGRFQLIRAYAPDLARLLVCRLTVHLGPVVLAYTLTLLAASLLGVPLIVCLIWWAIGVLYLGGWGLLTAALSLRSTHERTAAASALAVWLAVVAVLPAAVTLGADVLAPVPSRLAQLIAERRTEVEGFERTGPLLDRYLYEHPELAPVNEEVASAFPRSWYVVRRDVERRASPLVEEYRTARAARQRLMTGVQWITPAAATYTALVEVAGTGEAWFSAYDAQARRYARRLHEWLSVPIFRGEKLAVDAIGSVPRFRFEAPGVLGAAPPAAGYLLVLVVVLSLGLRRQLRRFDRRVLRHSPRARRSHRLAAAPAGVGTRPQL